MPGTSQTKKIPRTAAQPSAATSDDGFDPANTVPRDAPPSKKVRWDKLAQKARRESFAAIELKCLDCVCWERNEAKACAIKTCALWALNRRIFRHRGEEA